MSENEAINQKETIHSMSNLGLINTKRKTETSVEMKREHTNWFQERVVATTMIAHNNNNNNNKKIVESGII